MTHKKTFKNGPKVILSSSYGHEQKKSLNHLTYLYNKTFLPCSYRIKSFSYLAVD